MEEQSNNSAVAAAANSVSQDAKNMALLVMDREHLFWLHPQPHHVFGEEGRCLYRRPIQRSPELVHHRHHRLCAGLILTAILIGALVLVAVGICHLVFCIMGAVAVSSGKPFRVPFAIRLLK